MEDIEPPVLYVGNTVVSRAGGREGGREGDLQRNGGLTLLFLCLFTYHPQADGKREWRALPPCSEVRRRTTAPNSLHPPKPLTLPPSLPPSLPSLPQPQKRRFDNLATGFYSVNYPQATGTLGRGIILQDFNCPLNPGACPSFPPSPSYFLPPLS